MTDLDALSREELIDRCALYEAALGVDLSTPIVLRGTRFGPGKSRLLRLIVAGRCADKRRLADAYYAQCAHDAIGDGRVLDVLAHQLRKRLAAAGFEEALETIHGVGWAASPELAEAVRAHDAALRERAA